MQALILAAGMGNRLGKYTSNNTKCMVKVNGKTLIEYALEALSTVKLNRIVIVVGYESKKLMDFVGTEYNGIPIVYVNNEVYNKTNNIYSLWLSSKYFIEDNTILLESDIIFDKNIIKDIVKNENKNIAVLAKFESWMDGTVTVVDEEERIVNFISKKNFKWDDVENYYKTVNIYKLSRQFIQDYYLPFLNAYINALGNNEYYEQVLRVVTYLDNVDLKAHKLTFEKWYEVDDTQDLDIAEVLFSDNKDTLKMYQNRFGGYWRFPKLKDFCYLVNPYFPSKEMNDEIKSNFETLISEYPSGQNVQNLLAAKMFGCDPSEILVGNGAAELIKGLMTVTDGKIGVIYPTFNEYTERIKNNNIKEFVIENNNFSYSVDELKEFSKDIGTLILINPDNPSGHFLSKEEVLDLIEYLHGRNIKLIFDESFIDFASKSERYTLISSEYLDKYDNLIVIKSISKSYGVPGTRLGILASGNKGVISKVRKELSIWNINSFGEYFLQIMGKYKKDYNEACDKISEERNRFFKELLEIDFLRIIPSRANYFLCEVKSHFTATSLAEILLSNYGIYIKDLTGKKGFSRGEFIRIAVRDKRDNNFLIESLKEISQNIR